MRMLVLLLDVRGAPYEFYDSCLECFGKLRSNNLFRVYSKLLDLVLQLYEVLFLLDKREDPAQIVRKLDE